MMLFGTELKKEREKRGWSQEYLAKRVHVSRQSISKWETNKNYPNIEIIIDLSDLFDITIDELLRSDDELKGKIIKESKELTELQRKNAYKSTMKPAIMTIFFYWAALFIYSVYQYFTIGELGIPFYILNIGIILYSISNLIYILIYRRAEKK